MARIPFSRMPRKQQVAVLISLREKGLLGFFKPVEKFKNFRGWVKEFSQTADHFRDPREAIELTGKVDLKTFQSVDRMLDGWATVGPGSYGGRVLMDATKKGIRNSARFGTTTTLTRFSGEVEYLAKLRALNQAVLRKEFPSRRILLYRGVFGDQAKLLRTGKRRQLVDHHFLTSYTEDLNEARHFAGEGGVVLTIRPPIERSAYSWRIIEEPFEMVTEHFVFGGRIPVSLYRI